MSAVIFIELRFFPVGAPGSSRRVHGYTSLVIDSTSSRLFASCTDDIIYSYDLTSYGYETAVWLDG